MLSLVGQLGSAIVLVATLMVLVWLIAQGDIGVAQAGAAIIAISMLAGQVQSLFRGVQLIFESGLFLDDLDTFLALGRTVLEQAEGADAPDSFDTIQVDGVHFSYPGSAVEALRGVDIELRAGEIVALVGENGSGKTTLAKLLAGLYPAGDGRITWDGTDIADFRPASLRARISVTFQDFVKYAFTGSDNIAVGRVGRPPTPEAVRAAARAAGAEDMLDALPRVRHAALTPLRGRDRPVRRPVAAGGTGPVVLPRRPPRHPRRAELRARPARRARPLHHSARRARRPHRAFHLPPVLHRAGSGPDHRPRRRHRGRGGHPRRPGGGRRPVCRPLPAPVGHHASGGRSHGRRGRRAYRQWCPTSSTDAARAGAACRYAVVRRFCSMSR